MTNFVWERVLNLKDDCYANISEYANMIVPINHTKAMQSMLPKDRNLFTQFESSAIIGTAIDTITSIEYLKNLQIELYSNQYCQRLVTEAILYF